MTGHNIWDFGEIQKIIPKLYLLFLFYLVLYLYVRLYNKQQGCWLVVWAYASLVEKLTGESLSIRGEIIQISCCAYVYFVIAHADDSD